MRTKEEILKQVDEVMEEYIAPNVAQHGGQINILSFSEETGILHTHNTHQKTIKQKRNVYQIQTSTATITKTPQL